MGKTDVEYKYFLPVGINPEKEEVFLVQMFSIFYRLSYRLCSCN